MPPKRLGAAPKPPTKKKQRLDPAIVARNLVKDKSAIFTTHVKEVYMPSRAPSTNAWAIFKGTDNLTYIGKVPQVYTDPCSWRHLLVMRGKWTGNEVMVEEVLPESSIDPLTGSVFQRLIADYFESKEKVNSSVLLANFKWSQILSDLVREGYGDALLETDKSLSLPQILEKHMVATPTGTHIRTTMDVADTELNEKVLAACNSESRMVVTNSPYFVYGGKLKDVIALGLGGHHVFDMYPPELISDLGNCIRQYPCSVFYRSHRMAKVPQFDRKALDMVLLHTNVLVTQFEKLKLRTYLDFCATIRRDFKDSTCMPLKKFKCDAAVVDALVKDNVLRLIYDDQPLLQDVADGDLEMRLGSYLNRVAAHPPGINWDIVKNRAPMNSLDPSQQHALEKMFTSSVFILDAPGGFGKSHVSLLFVCLAALHGHKVLFLVPINAALDNLLTQIHSTMMTLSPTAAAQWQEESNDWNNPDTDMDVIQTHLREMPPGMGTIVLCSEQSVVFEDETKYDGQMNLPEFDILMFDEFSMESLQGTSSAMKCCPNLIIVGFVGHVEQFPPVKNPSLMQEMMRIASCRQPPANWSLLTLTHCHRVHADARLVVKNCTNILEHKPMENVCVDFSTPWVQYGAPNTDCVVAIAQKLMEIEGWDREDLLLNTMFMAYNHFDVNSINDKLFQFLFPDKPFPVPLGTLHTGQKIIFFAKSSTPFHKIWNNTGGIIKKIEQCDVANEKTLREIMFAKDGRRDTLTWTRAEHTTSHKWWSYRLLMSNRRYAYLLCLDKLQVKNGIASSDTQAQSRSVNTAICYFTNNTQLMEIPRPRQGIYVPPSRAIMRVVMCGNLNFMDELLDHAKDVPTMWQLKKHLNF